MNIDPRMKLIFKLEKAWLAKLAAKEDRQAYALSYVLEALEANDLRRALRICKSHNLPANLPDHIEAIMRAGWAES
jgi:hypothetical protein